MKLCKRIITVVITFAMILGMVGVMPEMKAKAADVVTATLESASGTKLVFTFDKEITIKTATAPNAVLASLKVNGTTVAIPSTANFAVWDTSTYKKVTVTITAANILPGDLIDVTFKTTLVAGTGNTVKPLSAAAPYLSEGKPTAVYDADKQVLNITTTGSRFVYIGVPKAKKVNGEQVEIVSAYDVFETDKTNKLTIDLSTYGVKKDVKLWIHGGTGDGSEEDINVAVVEVKANTKVIKPTYNYKDEKFTFTYKEGKENITISDISVLQYRVGLDTQWETCTTDKLKAAADFSSMYGTTIYFREAANETSGQYMFPSSESKLKIAKQANAPKITVDYVNETISFPKGVQVIALKGKGEWTNLSELNLSDHKTKLEVSDAAVALISISSLEDIDTNSLSFFVRTAAIANKPISKVSYVSIGKRDGAISFEDAFTYQDNLNSKNEVIGIKITNKLEGIAIEYAIAETTVTDPADIAKWTNVSEGKTITISKAKIDGKRLYFRIAGVKPTAANPIGKIPSAAAYKDIDLSSN